MNKFALQEVIVVEEKPILVLQVVMALPLVYPIQHALVHVLPVIIVQVGPSPRWHNHVVMRQYIVRRDQAPLRMSRMDIILHLFLQMKIYEQVKQYVLPLAFVLMEAFTLMFLILLVLHPFQ